jgi:hypothetical protein
MSIHFTLSNAAFIVAASKRPVRPERMLRMKMFRLLDE